MRDVFINQEISIKFANQQIVTLANGDFLLLRQFSEQVGSTTTFKTLADIRDPDGNEVAEILLNQSFSDQPSENLFGEPRLAALEGGGFAVISKIEREYTDPDSGRTGDQTDLVFQVFDENGTAISNLRNVHAESDVNDRGHSVTSMGDGFLVAWVSQGDDASDENGVGIKYRAFSKEGNPLSQEDWLNTTREFGQYDIDLTTLSDGTIVAMYQTPANRDFQKGGVVIKLLDENGQEIFPETRVITTEDRFDAVRWPKVNALPDGRFAISYGSSVDAQGNTIETDPYVQLFEVDRSGAGISVRESGPLVQLADSSANRDADLDVVGTAGGGFFAAWIADTNQRDSANQAIRELFGAYYKPDSTPDGDVVVIDQGAFRTSGIALQIAESERGALGVTWSELESSGGPNPFLESISKLGVLKAPIDATSLDQIIKGTRKSEDLAGGIGDDKINALAGNDMIKGGAGDDVVNGGAGKDTILGGQGKDTLSGGKGADTIKGGANEDIIDGGNGNDTLSGGDGRDEVSGGAGNDKITGDKGNDTLLGGKGQDTIRGGEGRDRIEGGRGSDTLFGGKGADDFVFRPREGNDMIKDFSANDRLLLSVDLNVYRGEPIIDYLAGFARVTPDGVLLSSTGGTANGTGDTASILIEGVTTLDFLADKIEFF